MPRIILAAGIVANAMLAPMALYAADSFALRSVSYDLPESDKTFLGSGSEVVNNSCVTCHSVEMVLTQPPLSKTAWEGIVKKMVKIYKAPVSDADVGPIVEYFDNLQWKKQSSDSIKDFR